MGLSDTETLTKLQVDLTSTDLRSVFECLRSGQQQGMIDFLFENNVVRRKANNTMAVTSAHEFTNLTQKNPNWAPIGIARRWECGHKPLLAGASEFNNREGAEAPSRSALPPTPTGERLGLLRAILLVGSGPADIPTAINSQAPHAPT